MVTDAPMTAPLGLEALDALARWAVDRGNDAGDFGVANAVSGRSLRNLGNGVLALIARVEAAESVCKESLRTARAAGFREGAVTMRDRLQADIDKERGLIVGDGYDYKSGEEHGLARAVRVIRYFDPAALEPRDEVAG